MQYKETGFRAFYHHFTVINMNDELRIITQGLPGADEATGVLAYGYADSQGKMMIAILCCAKVDGTNVNFSPNALRDHVAIKAERIENCDALFLGEDDERLSENFAPKLEDIKAYEATGDIMRTRDMYLLDNSRDQFNIDTVYAILEKKGVKPTNCAVKIVGLGENYYIGELLKEPTEELGYHKGDRIAFYLRELPDETDEKKKFFCFADLNTRVQLTAADMEDGTRLEGAVKAFKEDVNNDTYLEVLECLRDSEVWLPLRTTVDGKTFPDLLKNGDKIFLPVFSNEAAMGDYGTVLKKGRMRYVDVIALVRRSQEEIAGIVLNPFGESFMADKELWKTIEILKTRLS